MAANPKYEAMDMEMGDGDGPEDEGAESSYGITFTAEDAAVRGNRDVVLPSNILSAIAGASPNAAPGYGLLSSSNPALDVDYARDAVIPGDDSVDVTQESLIVEEPLDETPAGIKLPCILFAITAEMLVYLIRIPALLELPDSDLSEV